MQRFSQECCKPEGKANIFLFSGSFREYVKTKIFVSTLHYTVVKENIPDSNLMLHTRISRHVTENCSFPSILHTVCALQYICGQQAEWYRYVHCANTEYQCN